MGRPAKHKNRSTKEDILETARKKFLKYGFAGTSISQIADEAKVAKSLIYHHYTDKTAIWKAVKEKIIADSIGPDWMKQDFSVDNLETFLNEFMRFRFALYDNNPDLVSLMHWQRLERDAENLGGLSQGIINHIEDKIRILYQKGEIRKEIPIEIVIYLITSLPANPFLDHADFLKEESQKNKYIEMIIELLKIFN